MQCHNSHHSCSGHYSCLIWRQLQCLRPKRCKRQCQAYTWESNRKSHHQRLPATPDPSSLQLDDGANVGNANQETADSPNVHEQVRGATMQQQGEVAGIEPAHTSPAGRLQTGCRRSTRIQHAVQRCDPTPQTGSQQGVSQQRKGGNAMIAVVSPLREHPDDDGLDLEEPRIHPLSPSTVQEALSRPDAAEWQAAIEKEVRLNWPKMCGSHASCQHVSMLCSPDLCWPGKEMDATKPVSCLEGIGSALEETFRKRWLRSVCTILSG
jgi:hypothetical protein